MCKIWMEEIRKIASRKIIWLGILVLLAFLTFRLFMVLQNEYSTTIDGQTYRGKEAILKDQELAKEYAGPLTEEKVKEIYERFGFYYYDVEKGNFIGNFCNQYITEKMTNYRTMGGEEPEKIKFWEGENWEQNVGPLLKGDVQFDYIYGWDDFKETHGITVMLMLSIILIIGLSPIFAEEYSLKTADILLTTRRGKKSGIWLKISAAVVFSIVVYCLVSAYMWLMYRMIFGTQGLDASSVLLDGITSYGYHPARIGDFFLFMFFLGLAGVLLLSAMVLVISAICRNSFMAVIVSLILYVVPVAWLKIFSPMWILGEKGTKLVNHLMVSSPVYLPMNWGFAFRGGQIVMHIVIAVVLVGIFLLTGYKKYRNYQGH